MEWNVDIQNTTVSNMLAQVSCPLEVEINNKLVSHSHLNVYKRTPVHLFFAISNGLHPHGQSASFKNARLSGVKEEIV